MMVDGVETSTDNHRPYCNRLMPNQLCDLPWKKLDDSTILLTGGTGLVGTAVIEALTTIRAATSTDFSLIVATRNPKEARWRLSRKGIEWVECVSWRAGEPLPQSLGVKWLIHAAAPTSSRAFVEKPVETIATIVDGGRAALDFTIMHNGCRAVFLSSMEAYGIAGGNLKEDSPGIVDSGQLRSSYPEAKRLVECLCTAYAAEYSCNVSTIRLAQTFGRGVSPDDKRVFAEFGRCAAEKRDIALATDGSKRNPYISLDDAVSAIFHVLLLGKPGIYNAANEDTYCSILEMAEMVVREFGFPGMQVYFCEDDKARAAFPPQADFNLDSAKLRELGWMPKDTLRDMYASMLEGWTDEHFK